MNLADLNKHGRRGWATSLCSLGMALSIACPLSAQDEPIGPLVKDTAITNIEPVGTGCIIGSVLVLWDIEGVLTNLWVEFEAFDFLDVEPREQKEDYIRHKYCEILFDLKYPERYGLTVTVTSIESGTFLLRGITGKIRTRLSTEWQGPGDDAPRPVSYAEVQAKGPFYGNFSEDVPLHSESLVLPCGVKRPFVARIVKSFQGKPTTKERSFMRHERPKKTTDLRFKLTWRHCQPSGGPR